MTTIDLTPTPLQYEIMVGQTWDFEFQLTDDSTIPEAAISVAGAKIFADIKFEGTFIADQLSLQNGITLSDDNLTFFVKKDWRTITTINDVEVLTPSLSELPTGEFKMIITIVRNQVDTVTICLNINVNKDELQK